MTKISVIIPTFRRPEGLRRAVSSVLSQHGAPEFEIIVVDNAPEGGARDAIWDLPATVPVQLLHEPQPGVATARNTGWRAACAPRIAFLDDDEEAAPGWLAALDAAATALDADAVWGPIRTVLPEDANPAHADFLRSFFARTGPETVEPLSHYWGCGNSLIDRARAGLMEPPFDPAADQMGGEDDRLFSAMERRGARFGWAPGALVGEHVPASRATIRYALARSFAFGQGPSQTAADRKDLPRLAFWMGVGAAQTLVYGAATGAMWATRARRRGFMAGRTAQGLGKLIWFDAAAPKLYGAAQLAPVKTAAAQASSMISGASSSGSAAPVTSAARAGASGSTDSA